MLHFTGRITFGVDVGDFLELQRAFQCNREHGPATQIENVAGLGDLGRDFLDIGIVVEDVSHQRRHLHQGL